MVDVKHATQTALADDPAYDVSADEWNESHSLTGKERFYEAKNTDATKFNRDVVQIPDGVDFVVGQQFFVPADFSSLTSAVMIFISEASGNMYRSVASSFAASGEAGNIHTDSIALGAVALTANQITELSISDALTGLAAGDYVGVEWTRDGDDALDTVNDVVYYVGLKIKYDE